MKYKEELMELIEKEGDHKNFQYKNYECEINRIPMMGHLCGYIYLPKTHPLYGLNDSAIEDGYEDYIPVHGAITFTGYKEHGYCIGFDCAQSLDIIPGITILDYLDKKHNSIMSEYREYRTMEYVESVIRNMIDFFETNEFKGWKKDSMFKD